MTFTTISVHIKNPVDSLAMNQPGDSIRFDGISIRSQEKYFKPGLHFQKHLFP